MDITVCTKEELAQAVLELTVERGKIQRALTAAVQVSDRAKSAVKTLERMNYAYHGAELWKPPINRAAHSELLKGFPTLDPMAIDPRSVV